MISRCADYATYTSEDGCKSNDGVQCRDHLREFCCGDAASDDGADCSADSRNGSKLREHFRREADCGERSEDT